MNLHTRITVDRRDWDDAPLPLRTGPAFADYRHALHETGVALVVDVGVAADARPPSGLTSGDQIVLPYAGLFGYRVGGRTDYFDANRTLLAIAGEEFEDSHPAEGIGHASLVVTPAPATMDEICASAGGRAEAFAVTSRPASRRLQLLTGLLRRRLSHEARLAGDELVIAAAREALGAAPPRVRAPSARSIARTKEILHERGSERLSLDEIAAEVELSPAYLTQLFTAAEGKPLYRYQLNLRLSRALVELPDTDDITGLALDLGFSSHSHFSSAFRLAYGLSPSQYRAAMRDRA